MDWVAGFLEAVEMRRAAWEPLFNRRRVKLPIEPMVILGDDGGFVDKRDAGDRRKEFYASKLDVIAMSARCIHNFWIDHRGRMGSQPRRDPRPRR